MDAVEAASRLGMEENDAANYVNDARGQKLAYACMAETVSCMRQGNRRRKDWKDRVEGYKKDREGRTPAGVFWEMPGSQSGSVNTKPGHYENQKTSR